MTPDLSPCQQLWVKAQEPVKADILSLREYQAGSTEKATDPIDDAPTDRGAPVEWRSIALVIWSKDIVWCALP